MRVERWYVEQCAEHCGIKPSTWRDYVADKRAPAAAGHDPTTGRKWWRADEVRTWQANRDGQGTRTDLADAYLVGPDERRVFVSPDTIAAAELLTEIAAGRSSLPRAELRARWDEEFPEDNQTKRLPPAHINRRPARQGRRLDGKPNTAGTLAHRRVIKALAALDKLGVIARDGDQITVLDADRLRRIGAM